MVYPVPLPPGTHALLEDVLAHVSAPPAGLLEQVRHEPPRRPLVSPPFTPRGLASWFHRPGVRTAHKLGNPRGHRPSRRRRQGGLLGSQGCRAAGVLVALESPGPGQTPSHLGGWGGGCEAACAQGRQKQQQKQLSQKQQPYPSHVRCSRAVRGPATDPQCGGGGDACVWEGSPGEALLGSECRRKGRHCGARTVSLGDRPGRERFAQSGGAT